MSRTHAVVAAAALGLLAAACGSHASSSSPITTAPASTSAVSATTAAGGSTTTSTAASGDGSVCTLLLKYGKVDDGFGIPSSLRQARTEFATVVNQSSNEVRAAPASIKPTFQALYRDTLALRRWLQTTATLQEWNATSKPAVVAKPYADLSKRESAIIAWGNSNCGSVSSATTSTPSGTTATGDVAACSAIDKMESGSKQIESPSSLSQARKDFGLLVDYVSDIASAAPASLKPTAETALSEVRAVDEWADTKATDQEIAGNKVPAAIAKPLADYARQGQLISEWQEAHCPS
jgi:hypothetical protein